MSALVEKFAITEAPLYAGFNGYLNTVHQFPVLTEEEESELLREYRDNNNADAFKVLVCSHLRLVMAIVRKFRGYGLPDEDLVQEGSIGLVTAVDRFDPVHKVRLSTYATHWIKAAIGEYVIKNFRILKVATTAAQRKLFYKIRAISSKLGHKITKDEAVKIAEELEVRSTDVLEMEKRMLLPDVPYENNQLDNDEMDTSPVATLVADDGAHAEIQVIDDATKNVQMQALQAALLSLNERERRIMQARTLSPSGKDVKLNVLATELGISIERVRQLEKKAFAKVEKYVLAATTRLQDA